MELILVERDNGMVGGYVISDGRTNLVFNGPCHSLFFSMKHYTDMGYVVKRCVDEETFRRDIDTEHLPNMLSYIENIEKAGGQDE